MIDYVDFLPEKVQSMTWRQAAVYETMKELKARVRAWQEANPYKILNVETIFRPIFYESYSEPPEAHDAAFIPQQTGMGNMQIIRVWYDDGL